MSEMIRLENVTFGYDEGQTVLKDYSLKINQGEFVTILGHNGSGKSTLSKLLVGLIEAQAGKIFVDGQPLNEETVFEIRQKIGIVFQNPDNQFVGSTVRDDIAFGLENKCVSYEEMNRLVEEYATKVGMKQFLDREPHHLSGGEKQRVAIAGVLALGAKIIILDEATAMLDPQGRENMMELVHELAQDEDKTIIMITHDANIANHAKKVLHIFDGEIVEDKARKEKEKQSEVQSEAAESVSSELEKDFGVNAWEGEI